MFSRYWLDMVFALKVIVTLTLNLSKQNQQGSSTGHVQATYRVLRHQVFTKYRQVKVFEWKITVTLPLDMLISQSIGIIYIFSWSTFIPSLRNLGTL